jgi:predicted enzyme related to lactoylglutathione lyase
MAEPGGVGTFNWNELATTDAAKCKAFYTQLFGWTTFDMQVGPMTYTMFKFEGRDVGGMIQMDGTWHNVRPHWMSYVHVSDTDAAAKRITELGGKVCVPPTDIPNVGRFAVVEDPTGAVFSIIKMNNPPSK